MIHNTKRLLINILPECFIKLELYAAVLIQMSRVMRKRVLSHANNKGADQPAHPRSLFNAFVVHCLDSIISLRFYSQNFKTLASFCG